MRVSTVSVKVELYMLLCVAIVVVQPLAMKLRGPPSPGEWGHLTDGTFTAFLIAVSLPSCALPLLALAWAEHHAHRSRAARPRAGRAACAVGGGPGGAGG